MAMKTISWIEFMEEGEKNTSNAVCTKCKKILPDNLINLYSGLCREHIEEEMQADENC